MHGRCALLHTRLSVIDLLGGDQPMHIRPPRTFQEEQVSDPRRPKPRYESDGPLHLIFNGEVYNHRRLRSLLTRCGHRFSTDHSDTEVLLLGYRQWGTQLPKHLHGMFAFAIWDEGRRQLFVCRDRVGKKPLFLLQRESELMFASLVGTLAAGLPHGTRPGLNDDALLHYLQLGYTLDRPLFDGVWELPPAHWMTVEADGSRHVEQYWRPPPISKSSTSLGAADALREVLGEAVNSRLEADVPLGCFLSGGIDSSLVAAIAQRRISQRGGNPLRTFNVAMPEASYDETPHAMAVAEHLGTRHEVLHTRVGDAMDDLRQLMDITGDPNADSSLLPTHWLCKAAKQHVTVALSGDGGDELFGGYDRYRAMRWLYRHGSVLRMLPAGMADPTRPRSWKTRLGRLAAAAKAGPDPAASYLSMIGLFNARQIAGLMPERFGDLADRPAVAPGWPETAPDRQPHPVHDAMRWDLQHYLPHELLRKLDRASMAVALEVRCPLLDTSVCDLAGHLPPHVLMPGSRPKGLLRQVAAELLPDPIVRRPKRGFAVPIGQWFRTTLREPMQQLLLDGPLPDLGVDRPYVEQLVRHHLDRKADHTHRLFGLMQLALWQQWRS